MTKEQLQSELGALRRQLAWALYDRHVALNSKERELASARIVAIEAQRNKVVERLVECDRDGQVGES